MKFSHEQAFEVWRSVFRQFRVWRGFKLAIGFLCVSIAYAELSENCLPKSGTLSFVASDGTVKEINLNNVQKIFYKP